MISFRKFLTATLLFVFSLTSSGSLAGTAGQPSIQELVHEAKIAFDARDDKTFDDLLERVFQRITGFPSYLPHVPKGMTDDDYVQKRCEFDRITQPIFSTEFWNAFRYQVDLITFAFVRDGREQSVMAKAMTECRFDDGQLTITSQFSHSGIAWAKAFFAADAEQALRMAQAIKELSEENPKIIELDILATMVRLHAQKKWKMENPEQHERNRKTEKVFPQATLVDTADKGDLTAQLEVARRLETGDRFKQENAMAYFWYQRALKNGGGETAQAGLDRLLPHLTKSDFRLIEIWTRNNHRPY